eukprot:1372970-Karenia_brevis.AAC.1
MAIELAKNNLVFGENPQQAVLFAIPEFTCQHLYTRGRSPSTEKENDRRNPQDEMAMDEEDKNVMGKG